MPLRLQLRAETLGLQYDFTKSLGNKSLGIHPKSASSPKIQGARISLCHTLRGLRLIASDIPGIADHRIHPAAVVSGVVDPPPPSQIEAAYRGEIECRPVGIPRTIAGSIALVIKC